MKLSVIIISYNEKKYLPTAIDSCLSQNYKDEFEILIGDDGSSDGSIDIIRDYAIKYPQIIRYFIMDRDVSKHVVPSFRVSDIIKRGIEEAKGEYITVLSGDDYFCSKDKFSLQTGFLDRDKRKKYSASYSGYKHVWDDGSEEKKEFPYLHDPGKYIFWSSRYAHISCFTFRKEAVEKEQLLNRFCDDTGMLYTLACAGAWHYDSKIQFAYRQRDKSIMHEADVLELNILEVMLLQDTMQKGKLPVCCFAKYAGPLRYVFENRNGLKLTKYKKYLESSQQYPYDYLNKICIYDNLKLFAKIKFDLFIFGVRINRFIFDRIMMFYKIYWKIERTMKKEG